LSLYYIEWWTFINHLQIKAHVSLYNAFISISLKDNFILVFNIIPFYLNVFFVSSLCFWNKSLLIGPKTKPSYKCKVYHRSKISFDDFQISIQIIITLGQVWTLGRLIWNSKLALTNSRLIKLHYHAQRTRMDSFPASFVIL
jgi:hypothetical protein